jgi:hypothetical protein
MLMVEFCIIQSLAIELPDSCVECAWLSKAIAIFSVHMLVPYPSIYRSRNKLLNSMYDSENL